MELAVEGGGTIYENVVETASKTAREVAIPEEVIVGVTSGLLYQSNPNANASKVDWDSLVNDSEGGTVPKVTPSRLADNVIFP